MRRGTDRYTPFNFSEGRHTVKADIRNFRRAAGMTLIEIIAALAIIAVVVVGALKLFQSASSSNNATQMLEDLTALRSATQQLYLGQGGYGTVSLNAVLNTANKIPSDLTYSGGTISTPLGGTLTVTGASSFFTIALTNVPADVCTDLLTNAANGWQSVKVGSSTITTFPISPAIATASANCGGTAPFSLAWATLN